MKLGSLYILEDKGSVLEVSSEALKKALDGYGDTLEEYLNEVVDDFNPILLNIGFTSALQIINAEGDISYSALCRAEKDVPKSVISLMKDMYIHHSNGMMNVDYDLDTGVRDDFMETTLYDDVSWSSPSLTVNEVGDRDIGVSVLLGESEWLKGYGKVSKEDFISGKYPELKGVLSVVRQMETKYSSMDFGGITFTVFATPYLDFSKPFSGEFFEAVGVKNGKCYMNCIMVVTSESDYHLHPVMLRAIVCAYPDIRRVFERKMGTSFVLDGVRSSDSEFDDMCDMLDIHKELPFISDKDLSQVYEGARKEINELFVKSIS